MKKILSLIVALFAVGAVSVASAKPVNITPNLKSIQVKHTNKDGSTQMVTLMRNQNNDNTISSHYAKTSRPCPPFCVQPMNSFAPHDVEVLGEVGVINYIEKMQKDDAITLIDSRTSDWIFLKSGTIPGAINIPWTKLNPAKGATPEQIAEILSNEFGVKVPDEGPYNFSDAKTLVLFCNGMWCGQSPANIRTLLSMGYPAAKIKWYRGGMQNWEALGFTTVKSALIASN